MVWCGEEGTLSAHGRNGRRILGRVPVSDQAMYVGDRGMIAEIMRQGKSDDYADKDLESLLGTYIDEKNVRRTPRRKTKAGRYMWLEVTSLHRLTMRKSEERKTMCLFLSR